MKRRSFWARFTDADEWDVVVKDEQGKECLLHCWAGPAENSESHLLWSVEKKLREMLEPKPEKVPVEVRLRQALVGKKIKVETAG